jgi:signal transduction histidine kinase
VGQSSGAPRGFEWLLVADEPLPDRDPAAEEEAARIHSRLVGGALTPVLRQPIARIIANAETIRARLAGPLRDEYSEYASTIAAAGQHLSAMLDDLADLEVVEAPGFTTAKDRVDLADVAQRAAGILGVRAAARDIEVIVEPQAERVVAIAEFRRLLQILINLIGNAIAYSPEHSTVTITTHSREDDAVAIRVTDQGPGITADQAARIFDKFERLGRDGNDGHGDGGGEGGSGLGLYISHRLAAAMDGELDVLPPDLMSEFAGAVFELRLPAADDG